MHTNGTGIGEKIKKLRRGQKISRKALAEKVGISVSHLEKIESGARSPSMGAYQRIMDALKTDVLVYNELETVLERCVVKAQEILMECTDSQALYLIRVLEFSAQNINGVNQEQTPSACQMVSVGEDE